MKDDIINKILPREALEIIQHLAKFDKEIKNRIIEIAEGLFREFDVEEICEDVFYALDGIDVHDLWDSSGAKTDGYISSENMVFEMIDEQFNEMLHHIHAFKSYQNLRMAMDGWFPDGQDPPVMEPQPLKEWLKGKIYTSLWLRPLAGLAGLRDRRKKK